MQKNIAQLTNSTVILLTNEESDASKLFPNVKFIYVLKSCGGASLESTARFLVFFTNMFLKFKTALNAETLKSLWQTAHSENNPKLTERINFIDLAQFGLSVHSSRKKNPIRNQCSLCG